MAIFGIPPSHWVVHRQLNLLYQFWIHTETIKSLGILEYVLNTPSHHRVHHGCNRYCLDKNYAGVLIIWDRMFGTFQPEQEEVVYGLTHAINTFDPIVIQLGHLGYVLRTFKETQGIGNKLSVLFKGPGWSPGKPRLGLMEDLPDVSRETHIWSCFSKGLIWRRCLLPTFVPELLHKAPMKKFDPPMAGWVQLYLMVHLNLTTAMLHVYIGASTNLSILSHVMSTCFLVFCLVCFGTIANGDLVRGRRLEIARCLMTLVVLQGQWMSPVMTKAMSFTFFLSGYLWWTYGSGKIEKED
ncbi:unnamed protein product [Cyprideis torosa]|uniref:Fatty acid hydroxylase domain-containing protein n=2 Tax=Cyprideis torosa TaxID=163714 RepID=A0A7R8ZLS0_9CRUS|nr:unnamed protein product [Cyprideis torosa]CAG0893914.1 unnamed protein product [Cyprideis torosa]